MGWNDVGMNAIRMVAVLGFCAALAGCAGTKPPPRPGSITLAEARQGIEEGYDRRRAANVTKDVKGAMAIRTEDFVSIDDSGKQADRAAMEKEVVQFFSENNRWIHIEFAIDSVTLDSQANPIEADVISRRHTSLMKPHFDKKMHHFESWGTVRERWRWTPNGWKLAKTYAFSDWKELVDGKPRDQDPVTMATVREGIERGYARNREAFLAKDVKAIMALRTEDFYTIGPDGQRKDRAAMETYTVGFLNGIDRWIEIEFVIDSLSLNLLPDPSEADAIMRQHLVRMALRPDQKVHRVETWATQRERWRWSPDGWKLAMVDNVHDQKRLVDGQPE